MVKRIPDEFSGVDALNYIHENVLINETGKLHENIKAVMDQEGGDQMIGVWMDGIKIIIMAILNEQTLKLIKEDKLQSDDKSKREKFPTILDKEVKAQ